MITDRPGNRTDDPPFLNEIFVLLDKFLVDVDNGWPANRWLRSMPGMEVYVRRNPRSLPEGNFVMLDIANVGVTQTGRGTFTRFLDRLEALRLLDGIYLENVHDDRHVRYYQRRGYHLRPRRVPDFESDNLYRLWQK